MKKWYESKIIWFNVLMTILDILSLVEARALFDPTTMAVIHGAGNIILRVWFTNTKISK